MKKLSLDLDSLRVESFATASAAAWRRGTVQARNDRDADPTLGHDTCDRCTTPGLCASDDSTRSRVPSCPEASADDTCPSGPGCTQQADCKETSECDPPTDPCPGPFSLVSCLE